MYGGRGSAKSWTVARLLIQKAASEKLLILCTRELQKSIKQSVHRLLKKQIELLGLSDLFDITDTSIKCPSTKSEFIFLGVKHNTEEIKSTEGVNICWIEEGHSLSEDSWEIINPTIREPGSEVWITFNTRFKFDHIYKMFVVDSPPESSWVQRINHDDNPYFTDVLQNQMEMAKHKDYEKYLHIWQGELKQLATGAIFGKQITELKKAGRLMPIPIQKACEVHTFNDIGKNDPCAWWFMQHVGKEFRFIDYYENRFEDIDHYIRVVKALGYNYGSHWMPHDTDHERLGMVRNIKLQFEDGGIKPIEIVDRVSDKNIGIQQARDAIAQSWFHSNEESKPVAQCEGYISWLAEGWQTRSERMAQGWERLCNYRFKYNDNDDVYQQKPNHDRASNGADAYMQFAQGYEELNDEWESISLDQDASWVV